MFTDRSLGRVKGCGCNVHIYHVISFLVFSSMIPFAAIFHIFVSAEFSIFNNGERIIKKKTPAGNRGSVLGRSIWAHVTLTQFRHCVCFALKIKCYLKLARRFSKLDLMPNVLADWLLHDRSSLLALSFDELS